MPSISALEPVRVIEGGRLWIRGEGFPLPDASACGITVGGVPVRLLFAAPDRVAVEVPAGVPGGPTEVRVPWVQGATPVVHAGVRLATGLHQVDSPAFGPDGSLFVTYSGTRGQEVPVSIFRVTPEGTREAFVSGIVNATSLAVGPDGLLYVSSRFDGRVFRVQPDGRFEVIASDLGQATGLAFGADAALYVGDRTGTIYRREPDGRTTAFATLPASIAAYHLAMSPEGVLHASAPTLATSDAVYRIDADGRVEPIGVTFGRPQGLAFDPGGVLHVVEALAGSSGVWRVAAGGYVEPAVAGTDLIGVAFDGDGDLAVASGESIFLFRSPRQL